MEKNRIGRSRPALSFFRSKLCLTNVCSLHLEPQVKISDKILEESAVARILGCPREKSPRRVLEKRSSQIWSLRVALSQSQSSGERPT